MPGRKVAVLFVLLFAVAACGGGGGGTSPTPPGGSSSANPNSHGTMSAVIDGRTWTTNNVATASFAGGIFSIGGSTSDYILGFAVVVTGSGTFLIPGADRQTGQPPESAGNNALLIPVVNNVAQPGWAADITKGSGTIVLTALSATGASGTFSFSLAPSNATFGTAGSRPVSNGTFNVRF